MIRIELEYNSGRVELDTQDVSLQMTFEAGALNQLAKTKTGYSLAFRLPFTDANNKAIGFFEQVGVDIDTRQLRNAWVYEEGQLIFNGKLQVRGCELQGRYYDCVLYESKAGVFETLRESRWVDVFSTPQGAVTTALDHLHTAESIKESNLGNDITLGQVGSDVMWYPLQYARTYHVNQDLSTRPKYFDLTTANLQALRQLAKDQCPSISVKYLLENLFRHCGYTLDTSVGVFDTSPLPLDDLYMVIPREWLMYRPYYMSQVNFLQVVGAGYTSNTLQGSQNSYTTGDLIYLAFEGVTGGAFDPDGFFGSASAPFFGAFIPQTTGIYNMELDMSWTLWGAPLANQYSLGIAPYDVGSGTWGTPVYQTFTHDVALNSTTFYFQYDATDVNQTIVPVLLWNTGSLGSTYQVTITGAQLRMVSYIGDSPTLQIPSSLGEDKLDVWLSAIIEKFNLVVTFNDDANTCAMYLRNTFFERDTTQAIDWTEKVDRSKPMRLTNNLENLTQQVDFVDAEADDGVSKYNAETYGFYLTHYSFKPNIGMTHGSTTIGGYFAPARFMYAYDSVICNNMTYAYDSMRGIRAHAPDGDNDDCVYVKLALQKKPLLIYKGGAMSLSGDGYKFYDGTSVSDPYEFISQWYLPTIVKAGFYLSWSKRNRYDVFTGLNNILSLYEYVYKDELERKYNKASRILNASFSLTPQDIRALNYSDLIHIDGHYYYVDVIRNYVVGKRMTCDVTLTKFLNPKNLTNASVSCEQILVGSISDGGVVQFVDRDGNEVEGTEACCEYWGGGDWTWNAYSNTCNTNQSGDEPIDGDDVGVRGLVYDPNGIEFSSRQVVERFDLSNTLEEDKWTIYRFELSGLTANNVQRAVNDKGVDRFRLPFFSVGYIRMKWAFEWLAGSEKNEVRHGESIATYRAFDVVTQTPQSTQVVDANGDLLPAQTNPVELVVSTYQAVPYVWVNLNADSSVYQKARWNIDMYVKVKAMEDEGAVFALGIAYQDGTQMISERNDILTYQ